MHLLATCVGTSAAHGEPGIAPGYSTRHHSASVDIPAQVGRETQEI